MTRAELGPAIDLAAEFDRKIVVEEAVPEAREIECAVLGNEDARGVGAGRNGAVTRVLRLRGEVHRQRIAHRDSRRADATSRREEVRRQAIAAFQAIDGAGLARVDFLMTRSTGELFVNEINTIPGFTTISMFAKLWAASGVDYPALVDRLIALAIERHAEKQELKTSAF